MAKPVLMGEGAMITVPHRRNQGHGAGGGPRELGHKSHHALGLGLCVARLMPWPFSCWWPLHSSHDVEVSAGTRLGSSHGSLPSPGPSLGTGTEAVGSLADSQGSG